MLVLFYSKLTHCWCTSLVHFSILISLFSSSLVNRLVYLQKKSKYKTQRPNKHPPKCNWKEWKEEKNPLVWLMCTCCISAQNAELWLTCGPVSPCPSEVLMPQTSGISTVSVCVAHTDTVFQRQQTKCHRIRTHENTKAKGFLHA